MSILILYSSSIYSIKQVILKSVIIIMRILYILRHNFHKQQVTTYCLHKSVSFVYPLTLSMYTAVIFTWFHGVLCSIYREFIVRVKLVSFFNLKGLYRGKQIFSFSSRVKPISPIQFKIVLQGKISCPISISLVFTWSTKSLSSLIYLLFTGILTMFK